MRDLWVLLGLMAFAAIFSGLNFAEGKYGLGIFNALVALLFAALFVAVEHTDRR